MCLQAGGYKFKERVWTTSAPSVTERPALSAADVQKHHRRRPEETDHHGQPGRDSTKRSSEGHTITRRPLYQVLVFLHLITVTVCPRSLPDELCSAPSQMSRCAAGAERPASPTLRTSRPPLTYCSPARCPRADTPPPPTTFRARRVSLNCSSCFYFVFKLMDKTLCLLIAPVVLQCLCQPLSCLSPKLETKSPL